MAYDKAYAANSMPKVQAIVREILGDSQFAKIQSEYDPLNPTKLLGLLTGPAFYGVHVLLQGSQESIDRFREAGGVVLNAVIDHTWQNEEIRLSDKLFDAAQINYNGVYWSQHVGKIYAAMQAGITFDDENLRGIIGKNNDYIYREAARPNVIEKLRHDLALLQLNSLHGPKAHSAVPAIAEQSKAPQAEKRLAETGDRTLLVRAREDTIAFIPRELTPLQRLAAALNFMREAGKGVAQILRGGVTAEIVHGETITVLTERTGEKIQAVLSVQITKEGVLAETAKGYAISETNREFVTQDSTAFISQERLKQAPQVLALTNSGS